MALNYHHSRRKSNSDSAASWLYEPIVHLAERVSSAFLIFISIVLMVVSQIHPNLLSETRTVAYDLVSPIMATVVKPVYAVSNWVDHVTGISNLVSVNAKLTEENAKLYKWYEKALQLEAENRSLRDLVNMVDMERKSYVTARVIADPGGPFVHSVIVWAGTRNGVKEGQSVVTGKGLVGRISETGHKAARVLLLTDLNSRVPVVIERSRQRAMVAGDNTDKPKLIYLPDGASVEKGDRLVTSGHGGLYIPGIPVAVVEDVFPGKTITVRPLADLDKLEYVQVIDFGMNMPLAEKDDPVYSIPTSTPNK